MATVSGSNVLLKLVFAGNAEAARANLAHIEDRLSPDAQARTVNLPFESGLEFDPAGLGEVEGFVFRLQVCVPGDDHQLAKALSDADGVAWVVDAQSKHLALSEGWECLLGALAKRSDAGPFRDGSGVKPIPVVYQLVHARG